MTRINVFLFATMSLLLAACNTYEPIPNQLIGTWSEPYHVSIYVKSFTFYEDGRLEYQRIPDTTWNPVIDEAGDFGKLNFKVKNNKMYLSGMGLYSKDDTSKYEYVPFEYVTDYSIMGNTLTIDSFSCDGGLLSRFYYNIKLLKL